MAGEWERELPFVTHNRKLIEEVQELEHKARRQDVLVDDELIHAFYDKAVPADVCSGASFERWFRAASKGNAKLLQLSRDELMRHEAAGITTAAFPRVLRLGGIDCAASYLHEPGDAKDGLTVTVPIYTLNQVSVERCEWLVPGMLRDKVLALIKSLHQRPRSRLMPLAEFADEFVASTAFGDGSLMDALLAAVRERTQLAVQRTDFKAEQLGAHLFMNLRVADEHGRQLGNGRDIAGLKAELGGQARSAFQALAAIKLGATSASAAPAPMATAAAPAATGRGVGAQIVPAPVVASTADAARYTDWSFGELPELLEIRRAGQTLIGFPALMDRLTHVEVEVFDEPLVASARHRAGLRRLVALQLREPLKYLEKNIPELNKMGTAFMALGTLEELREQIIEVALDRAFMAEPLPVDARSFRARVDEGRARLNLVAQEVARQSAVVLLEWSAVQRKLKDSRPSKEVADDIAAQLARLLPKHFVTRTPWAALQHLPRYLKAIALRLDKLKSDPSRDEARMAELRPLEQRYLRRVAELKGASHERMDEYRWLLEELRVGLFAQELRTREPVSAKRLDKVWAQLSA